MKTIIRYIMLALLAVMMGSCSIIYEDLDDCPSPPEPDPVVTSTDVTITYNLSGVIESDSLMEKSLGSLSSHNYDSYFFDDNSKDFALKTRYSNQGTSLTIQGEMDINKYMNVPMTDVKETPQVTLSDSSSFTNFSINNILADSIGSHAKIMYYALETMNIDTLNREFTVNLSPMNSVVEVIIDTTAATQIVKNVTVSIDSLYTGINFSNDFLYTFSRKEIVKTYPAVAIEQGKLGFVGVGFPSPEEWYYTIKAALTTGETVYTRIKVEEKLKPGEKRILEIKMNESGTIGDQELQQNMGMSVITTWKEGHTYEPSI